MRVLFVTQVRLDRPHGGPRHVLAVARELAALGHAVTLVAPGEEPDPPDGVRRVRAARAEPGARLELAHAGLVAREAARVRPDVAYVRLSATSSAVPAALAALRIPVVLELNGRILDELRALGRSEAAVRGVQASLRVVVRAARAVVAVEDKIGRHARDALFARRVHVIENGADTRVAVPGDRAAARARLGLDPGARIVAFAGTLVPELRLDLLLAALARLPDDVQLVVAGDGPARAALDDAGPRVRALGPRPHGEALDLLRAADVAVNVRDGDMGMKALEYAALGRRFVAFRVEGAARLEALYPDHAAAFLVDARTPEGLADGIRAALDAERAAGPLPEGAVEAARAQVGWDRTAARIAEVLDVARRT